MSIDKSIGTPAKTYNRLSSESINNEIIFETEDSRHLAALFLNVTLWALVVLLCIEIIFSGLLNTTYFQENLLWPTVFAFFATYTLYIIESFTSDTFGILFNSKKVSEIKAYIDIVKNTSPEISVKCQSYNLIDIIDNKFTNEKKYQYAQNFYKRIFNFRKIIGTTKNRVFEDCRIVDMSDDLKDKNPSCFIWEVNFYYNVVYSGEAVKKRYIEFREIFKKEVEKTDGLLEFTEIKRIPFSIKKMTAMKDGKRPLSANWIVFSIFSIFLLASWPYRLWLDDFISRNKFTFRKVIFEKTDAELDEI